MLSFHIIGDRLPFPILPLPNRSHPGILITNPPHSHFRYVSTTWCPTFLPKLVHRAQIFITRISPSPSPSACLAIHPSERYSQISLLLSPFYPPILTAGGGRTTRGRVPPRGSFEFSRTGCAPRAFQSPVGTPRRIMEERERWPPQRTKREGRRRRGW